MITKNYTGFIELGKKYIVQDAEWNGEKCLVITEDKGTTLKIETTQTMS